MEDHLCYLGYFKDGMLSGSGVFSIYQRFLQRQFQGKQPAWAWRFILIDGDKYSGQFRNGYPNGKGWLD